MTDNPIELSRRKILAGMGTIGAASAGVGLGTSAYFSDEEDFANNRLVAGSLDLKVDWEEHYSDWSPDESEGLNNDVLMPGDDIPDDYVGLPFCSASPSVFVDSEDLATFMDNTSIEAMPDDDNDGIQDTLPNDICATDWDTQGILDPSGPRTDNDATEDITRLGNGDPAPLIYLQDVKPGDFGEVTLSFHLCDNPGYVWLNGELTENAENGLTEPESKDPDENGGEPGELAEALRACVWYDANCDNMIFGRETEVMLATDVSESIDGDELAGAPSVDGEPGDTSALEAIKGAIGDADPNVTGFLTALENSCPNGVEIGAASFAENLEHLDNDDDGDDTDDPAGNDADGLDAVLDKALMPVGAANQTFPGTDNPNAGTDNISPPDEYMELKLLFGRNQDFTLQEDTQFVVDDISDGAPFGGSRYASSIEGNDDYELGNGNDTYIAERPYTGDGDSTQDDGIVKAIQALLPGGETFNWSPGGPDIRGIDPSGNAAEPMPGEAARKVIIYITDGTFGAIGEDDPDPVDAAEAAAGAEDLGIEIKPILVNENPSSDDVAFAQAFATSGQDPLFVNRYDDSVSPGCDSDVTDAGFSCVSMLEAMDDCLTDICAGSAAGDDQIIFNGRLVDLLDELSQGQGIPLDGDIPAEAGGGTGRNCFAASNTHCIGFEWWLPVDHANEIQTDSIGFDLGFYAEQCRHNDGSGMTPEGEGA